MPNSMLRKFFSIPILSVSVMKEYWILSNAFPVSIEIIVWFYFFVLLMWHITLINFLMLNYSCIPGHDV